MLDSKTLSVFGIIINFGHLIGLSPYKFVKSKSGPEVQFNNSSKYWRRLVVSVSFVNAYNVYLTVQSMRAVADHLISPPEKIKPLYTTGLFFIYNLSHLITLQHYAQHHKCINAIIQTAAKLQHTFGVTAGNNGGTRRVLYLLSAMLSFGAISRGFGVFIRPEAKDTFSSLFDNPRAVPLPLKCIIGLFHFYIISVQNYFFTLHGATVFCYVAATLSISQKMTVDRAGWPNQNQGTDANADSAVKNEEDPKVLDASNGEDAVAPNSLNREDPEFLYTLANCQLQLGVLQNNFRSIYGYWTLEMQLFAMLIVICNVFLAVVTADFRALTLAGFALLLLVLFFRRFAEIYESSHEAIESWKGMSSECPIWFKKFQRSCRALRINVASFFYADKALILTMLSVIVDNATSLILSYKTN